MQEYIEKVSPEGQEGCTPFSLRRGTGSTVQTAHKMCGKGKVVTHTTPQHKDVWDMEI